MEPFIPIFRFSLILILGLFAVGVTIMVFRRYSIDYLRAFEMNETNRVREVLLFKVALNLFLVWNICLVT